MKKFLIFIISIFLLLGGIEGKEIRVQFPRGSAELTDSVKNSIKIGKIKTPVLVVGFSALHECNDPDQVEALSVERAEKIQDWLQANGIQVISADGMGSWKNKGSEVRIIEYRTRSKK